MIYIFIHDAVVPDVPIYDKPVRADQAHTEKPSGLSPEALPIIMYTFWDNGSSEVWSVEIFVSVNIGLGGSTVLSH